MDNRRFVVFVTVSMLFWLVWFHVIVPRIMPPPERRPTKEVTTAELDEPADALFPANMSIGSVREALPKLPEHPAKMLWLGPETQDPAQLESFFLAARFNSRGARLETAQLTDVDRYPALKHRGQRLDLLGGSASGRNTFDLRIPVIDERLEGQTLDRIAWEIAETTDDSVTFRILSPDGIWEVQKEYRLHKVTDKERKIADVRDNLSDGYKIALKVKLRNLSGMSQKIQYTLDGPTGIPLEDRYNATKYRDIRVGFLRDDGVTIDESKMTASEVVSKEKKKAATKWTRPIKYVGIDVAYFAVLVFPSANQVTDRTIEAATPVIATEETESSSYSDVTVELKSKELIIPSKGSVEHTFSLYTGPKQNELLQQIGAISVLDYGWFDSICRGMVWILNGFHSLGLSYGVAIIWLTILVRTCLIPLSIHQAAHSARMKEVQPKLQAKMKELEARHGKNTEEYNKATQEMMGEQFKMMRGGCLPIFLQLPIFIGLYRAISSSIQLRMEPFLWFDNLAAPDALFELPGKLPLLGWTEINLLPWVSIGLMMLQQKMTMPPPQNEEQEAQAKMMNVMMVVTGVMFYKVPAGLCIYFIMTNIWSMTERWIFEQRAKRAKLKPPEEPPSSDSEVPGGPPKNSSNNPNPPQPKELTGFWKLLNQLQEAADKETSIRREERNGDDKKTDPGNGRPGKKKKGKR